MQAIGSLPCWRDGEAGFKARFVARMKLPWKDSSCQQFFVQSYRLVIPPAGSTITSAPIGTMAILPQLSAVSI